MERLSKDCPVLEGYRERYGHLEEELGPAGFEKIYNERKRGHGRAERIKQSISRSINSMFRDMDPYTYSNGFTQFDDEIIIRNPNEAGVEHSNEDVLVTAQHIGELAAKDTELRATLEDPKSSYFCFDPLIEN